VLAVAIAFLLRLGLAHGFLPGELAALGLAALLLMLFPLFAAPTGFIATLIVAALIARRCGLFARLFSQGRVRLARA
jgi:arabinofuranan 3-O-arabinosyltransferase